MAVLSSFSGIDGAGKSTQVKLLSDYLKSKGFKVHVTESMFGYFLLRVFVRTLRKATKSQPLGPVRRNKTNPFFKIWGMFAFFDIWLSYLFRIRRKMWSYDFVLADRFYTDIIANLVYYGYLPDFAFRLLLPVLPRPDKGFLFSVRPGSVLAREKEFPRQYYEEQAKIYDQFPKYLAYIYVVDANRSAEGVFREIVKEVGV